MKRASSIALFAAYCAFGTASIALADDGHGHEDHAATHDSHGGHGISWDLATTEGKQLWGSIFNFGLLVAILFGAGGPKINAFLAGRKEGVQTALNEAAEMKAKAEAKFAEYQARLANLDNELAEIRSEIVKSGEVERERIVSEAEHKAARLRRDTEFLVEQQLKQLRLDLHKEMVEAALAAAEKVITTKATLDDQQRIAREFIRTMSPFHSSPPPRVTQMPMPPPPKLRPPEGANS